MVANGLDGSEFEQSGRSDEQGGITGGIPRSSMLRRPLPQNSYQMGRLVCSEGNGGKNIPLLGNEWIRPGNQTALVQPLRS